MKARVLVRPTGYINGRAWPAVGEVIDLPAAVVESMAGWVEKVDEAPKVEKRPASRKGVEKRVSPDAE